MKTGNIERRRLGEQVFEVLSSQILSGKYPAGMHLSENRLCAELGVSRTPVREALYRLEEKGLVLSHPNRGFFIASPNQEKVEEAYPILAMMDARALCLCPKADPKKIKDLRRINEKIKTGSKDPLALHQMDLDFHATLVRDCTNSTLLSLIGQLKSEARLFDGGFKRGLADPEGAAVEHEEIIAALEAGDNEKAARLLEKHWVGGIKTVTTWIDSQETKHHDNKISA